MAMVSASLIFKPSKWFSHKSFNLSRRLRRRSSSKPESPSPPPPPPPARPCAYTAKFHEAFCHFDMNGDGKISSEELKSFLAWVGEAVSSEEAERVIADLDSDGDGLMDYDDFVRLMEGGGRIGGGGGDEDLRRAFEMFEAEKGSGRITAEGLRRALSRLGDVKGHEECVAMIRAYDLDGNGELDYNEFCRMMS